MKPKLIRITTAPISMNIILKGQLAFMEQYFEVIGVTAYDEKHFNEVAARENIRMFEVNMRRTISPIQDLKSLWKLYRFIRKEKPEIVHTHTPKAGLLGMLAANMAGVPVKLHTVAGMPLVETTGAKRQLLNFIEKLTYRCADKIYPNSKGLEDIIFENRFCKREKAKVIANGSSNGIDTDYFTPDSISERVAFNQQFREQNGIAQDDVVFCFVGRLCIEKGIAELVTAFRKLLAQNPGTPIKLLFVGPFEKENGALSQEMADAITSIPEIIYVGRHDDIRPYLSISDIFVFPSYREGFPNVVLQAGAMGLPCIVSNINGCNEIVKNGENGLIVDVKSSDAVFDAMQKLLHDTDLRNSLASKARENIVANYKRNIIWQALLTEYNFYIEQVKK
ncbi:glycosyltransferase family 4 protein [Flavobacterium sp.]|uniref:glycosyltransferase family 4 protein n=1 Tax=Flavobacterium sp. TaxID=239 RepID=UPI0026181536|nr:glycosyltransferase family 4 protein [Flavobacterium sp.]